MHLHLIYIYNKMFVLTMIKHKEYLEVRERST